MENYGIYILYALIFTSVVLIVEALFLALRNVFSSNKQANERIRLIEKTGDDAIGLTLLDGISKRPKLSLLNKLDTMLWAANFKVSPTVFIIASLCLGLIGYAISQLLGMGVFRSVIFVLMNGIVLPYGFLARRAQKRRDLFSAQLIPAIDLVSRGLQAGHPAAVALEIVSKEMPDPIGTEFGLAIDEINYGLDRNVALSNMARRFPNGDLKFFVSAMEVQRETGGNIVEVLNNLRDAGS